MPKYVTEFIGTFFLVFTVGMTITIGAPIPPLAIGMALMVMVYMGGHISGAHYNPAVSIALTISGALPRKELLPYLGAQLLGAITAGGATWLAVARTFSPGPGTDIGPASAFLVELLFTFALALVVLNVATSKKTAGNSYYGLAIGFTIAAGAFAGGTISGGVFNPAVAIGSTLWDAFVGPGDWRHIWLYLTAPPAGGILAALVFKVQERG